MKKRFLAVACTLALTVILAVAGRTEIHAKENLPMVDGSYLTHESESIGYATPLTRGQYLQMGYSKIVRLGPGVVYAGGTTAAWNTSESVQISVMVEKCKGEGEPWYFVDGWHKENNNADLVSANRRVEVEGDWYYRVRSIHSVNSDMSSSYTDGIFIEKP